VARQAIGIVSRGGPLGEIYLDVVECGVALMRAGVVISCLRLHLIGLAFSTATNLGLCCVGEVGISKFWCCAPRTGTTKRLGLAARCTVGRSNLTLRAEEGQTQI